MSLSTRANFSAGVGYGNQQGGRSGRHHTSPLIPEPTPNLNVRFATIPCTKSLFLEGTKHVVPLAWVWDRGAREWLGQKRRSIANDPVNLLPVKASLSKGAKGPDEWLPPLGECGYVARFVRVVKSYYLQPTAPELACL